MARTRRFDGVTVKISKIYVRSPLTNYRRTTKTKNGREFSENRRWADVKRISNVVFRIRI